VSACNTRYRRLPKSQEFSLYLAFGSLQLSLSLCERDDAAISLISVTPPNPSGYSLYPSCLRFYYTECSTLDSFIKITFSETGKMPSRRRFPITYILFYKSYIYTVYTSCKRLTTRQLTASLTRIFKPCIDLRTPRVEDQDFASKPLITRC
jgi:hypothetical protein